MYAIIFSGGKQYKVKNGDVLDLELLDANPGDKLKLIPLLVSNDDSSIVVGKDAQAKTVTLEVVAHQKGKKLIVYKYKAKKNVRKKAGHRQRYTRVKVLDIA